jgi:23S rRNA pseudouridine2605 synthase
MAKAKREGFKKFMNVEKGSAKKERFKKEKRKIKSELRAEAEKRREEKAVRLGFTPTRALYVPKVKAYDRKKEPNPATVSPNKDVKEITGMMPLNKFVAHAGVCSRRDAIPFIKEGKVQVNNQVIKDPGHKVSEADVVTLNGKKLHRAKNLVYILLNKPKDYITTAEDPQGRKTVIDLVKHASAERVFPVGRLDRNTSGVLLLTNDGELAQKLTHPSYEIKKIYEVRLDKPLTQKDYLTICDGVTLEDGFIQPDALGYQDEKDKSILGIEIHSGRNRIVRRIFEFMGYDVKGLDRVMFAGLTKKNVDRGKWRLLAEKEIRLLKFMNTSYVKNTEKKVAPAPVLSKKEGQAIPSKMKEPKPSKKEAFVKKEKAPKEKIERTPKEKIERKPKEKTDKPKIVSQKKSKPSKL